MTSTEYENFKMRIEGDWIYQETCSAIDLYDYCDFLRLTDRTVTCINCTHVFGINENDPRNKCPILEDFIEIHNTSTMFACVTQKKDAPLWSYTRTANVKDLSENTTFVRNSPKTLRCITCCNVVSVDAKTPSVMDFITAHTTSYPDCNGGLRCTSFPKNPIDADIDDINEDEFTDGILTWDYEFSCPIQYIEADTPFRLLTNNSLECTTCGRHMVIERPNRALSLTDVITLHDMDNIWCNFLDGVYLGNDMEPSYVEFEVPDYEDDIDINILEGGNREMPEHMQWDHRKFILQAERMKTFDHWPIQIKQTPSELTATGLWYTGTGDICRCFHCGFEVYNWLEGENPWAKHHFTNKNCEFIKQHQDKIPGNNKHVFISTSRYETDEEGIDIDEKHLCIICASKEIDTALLPCAHYIMCYECSDGSLKTSGNKCPICKEDVKTKHRLYKK